MTKTKHDWSRADAMTDAEIHAAAVSDPDAQPLGPEDFNRMKRTPRVKIIRRALGLSQEEFARRFGLRLEMLRGWEDRTLVPDPAAVTLLRVIWAEPEAVQRAVAAE